jgi:predicted nucleotidyltransferase
MASVSQFPKRPREKTEKLKRTIKLLSKILADLKVEYRVFGSVVIAAILGRSQRKLGDIDLMVDKKDKDRLFQGLRKAGYNLEERRFRFLAINFVWAEAEKNDLLSLTIFLGNFDKEKNFVVKISKNLSAVAHTQAIKPTVYHFYNAHFMGIPAVTAYYGALASRGNPKRKYDLAVFELKKIKKPAKDYSVIEFYYQDKKLPFLYPLGCFWQDFLGRISVFLGGHYDFWRR